MQCFLFFLKFLVQHNFGRVRKSEALVKSFVGCSNLCWTLLVWGNFFWLFHSASLSCPCSLHVSVENVRFKLKEFPVFLNISDEIFFRREVFYWNCWVEVMLAKKQCDKFKQSNLIWLWTLDTFRLKNDRLNTFL